MNKTRVTQNRLRAVRHMNDQHDRLNSFPVHRPGGQVQYYERKEPVDWQTEVIAKAVIALVIAALTLFALEYFTGT